MELTRRECHVGNSIQSMFLIKRPAGCLVQHTSLRGEADCQHPSLLPSACFLYHDSGCELGRSMGMP